MSSEARTYLQLSAVVWLWLVCVALLGLGVAGCMTDNQKAAERRARFEVMMNDINQMEAISERSVNLRKELHPRLYTVEVGSSAGADFTLTNVFSITQHDPFCQEIQFLKDGKTNVFHAWQSHVLSVKKESHP